MPAPVVLCPMEVERQAVARALARANLHDTELIRTGIGKHAIVRTIESLAARPTPPPLIILAGAAGGLKHTNDVPTIARIVDLHGHAWIPTSAPLPQHTPSAESTPAPDTPITLLGTDELISSPAHKKALADLTGASIVDMESHAFCAACERAGIPWSIVRGVSDGPHELLPAQLLSWIAADGRTRYTRAIRDLFLHPTLISPMLGVMRRSNRVLPQVGQRVAEILKTAPASQPLTDSVAATAMPPKPPTPLPIHAPADLIILIGGTFDPVHRAHVELAQRARLELAARNNAQHAWLVFVPAGQSPFKPEGATAPAEDRAEMLRLALAGIERAAVWTDELDRTDSDSSSPQPTFTIDTIRRARAWLTANALPDTPLRLLIGADQAAQFHRWREARAIVNEAEPAVMLRDDASASALITRMRTTAYWTTPELNQWRERILEIGTIEASASRIREQLAEGHAAEAASMLDPTVADYIHSRGLYR